jgi:hypothetical protein
MGESASSYRIRLQKRLNGLMILCAQLQHEVDLKSIEVKDARDHVRELEVKRLRLELQVANICTILQQRKTFSEGHYFEISQERHPLLRQSEGGGRGSHAPQAHGSHSNRVHFSSTSASSSSSHGQLQQQQPSMTTHPYSASSSTHPYLPPPVYSSSPTRIYERTEGRRWSQNSYDNYSNDIYSDIDPSSPIKKPTTGSWIICPPPSENQNSGTQGRRHSLPTEPISPKKSSVGNVRDHARDVMNIAVQLLQSEYSPSPDQVTTTEEKTTPPSPVDLVNKLIFGDDPTSPTEVPRPMVVPQLSQQSTFQTPSPSRHERAEEEVEEKEEELADDDDDDDLMNDENLNKLIDETLSRVDELTVKTASFTPPPQVRQEVMKLSSKKKTPLRVGGGGGGGSSLKKKMITPRTLKYSTTTVDEDEGEEKGERKRRSGIPPRSLKKSSRSLSPTSSFTALVTTSTTSAANLTKMTTTPSSRGRDSTIVITQNSAITQRKELPRELETPHLATKKRTKVLTARSPSSECHLESLSPEVASRFLSSSPYETIKSSELLALSPRKKSSSPSRSPSKASTPVVHSSRPPSSIPSPPVYPSRSPSRDRAPSHTSEVSSPTPPPPLSSLLFDDYDNDLPPPTPLPNESARQTPLSNPPPTPSATSASDDMRVIGLLSSRLNTIADDAVMRDYGIIGLKQNTVEIKMKRQEAVIEELLSMILEGGITTHSSEGHDGQGIEGMDHHEGSGDVNLDEILFLLRSQQHELQEIQQNRNKGLHSHFYDTHSGGGGASGGGSEDEDQNSPYGVSSYFNGLQHNSSPDERGGGGGGGSGGQDSRRSRSPQRSVSRWIGGGTSHSHHLQGKDNKFNYAPTNHQRRASSSSSHHSRSASPLRPPDLTPHSSHDHHPPHDHHAVDAYHTRLTSTLERSPSPSLSPSPSPLIMPPHDQTSPSGSLGGVGASPLKDIANIATDMVRISKEIVQDTLLPPPPPPPLSTLPPSQHQHPHQPHSQYKVSTIPLRTSSPHSTPSPLPPTSSSRDHPHHRGKTTPVITPYHPTPKTNEDQEEEEENGTTNTSVWNISGSSCDEIPQEGEMRQLPSVSSFITPSQLPSAHHMPSPHKIGGRGSNTSVRPLEKSNSLITRTADGYSVLENSAHHHHGPSDPLIIALSPEYQALKYSSRHRKESFEEYDPKDPSRGGGSGVRRSPSPKKKQEHFSPEDLVEEIHSQQSTSNRHKSLSDTIEELQTQLYK